MTNLQFVQIGLAIYALAALAAIAFAFGRARRAGARAAFLLGGLFLLCYVGASFFVYQAGAFADVGAAGASLSGKSAQTELIENAVRASVPVAWLEPLALLCLALGFGAVARAADAQEAAGALAAPESTEDVDTEPDRPEAEEDFAEEAFGDLDDELEAKDE